MVSDQTFERPEGGGGIGWMFNHMPTILWQRRMLVVTTFVLIFAASVIAAYSLPTLYRSSAALLVESSDLSSNIVSDTSGREIEQRIAKIRERILSRGDLISLIEQFNLYPSERRSKPMSKVVEKMREATTVGALENDIGQPNQNQSNVIAVTMSFDYAEPAEAQQVMQSYVTRFLQMNNESVEEEANLTVRFLEDQAGKLQAQIRDIEGQITALKARNGAALAGSGMPSMVDTGSYSAQIASLENQNRQLLAMSRSPSGGSSQLAQAEAALAAARATFSDSHPDVVQARERLRELRRIEADNGDGGAGNMIQEQIRANNAAIASLTAARNAAIGRANSAMAGQARAPAILEQAMQLESRASTLREQYRKIADELLVAQNNARLANEQRSERLSLVEPPDLPDRPHWPNRPILIGAGAAAGLVLGLLLALVVEFLGRPMRSPRQIQGLGLPVLGVVPVLGATKSRRRFRLFRKKQKGYA